MFDKIKSLLQNKDILILGFGKEGASTLTFIRDYIDYKSVTVSDLNDVSSALPSGVLSVYGKDYQASLEKYDVIIKSPGVVLERETTEIIEKLTSQTELFLMEFSSRTVGVTGTKGKSTTTTLICHIMQEAGINAKLTGNIGIPPLDVAREMTPDAMSVFEMSCHQLEYTTLSPHIAVILNLYEDHLDHYGTRDKYVKAKENIFLHQTKEDIFIVNAECTEQIKKSTSKTVSVGEAGEAFVKNGRIVTGRGEFTIPSDKISLFGIHNHYNIGVAKSVCDLFEIDDDTFKKGLMSYKPLPHRLEYVATVNGVEYYDDSISTVPETTIMALEALEGSDTVIIGGMDRGIDYSPLIEYLSDGKVKNIILAYESGKRIAGVLREKGIPHTLVEDLEKAVETAHRLALPNTKCILSPAAASYGYFKNFEHRGEEFARFVRNLSK